MIIEELQILVAVDGDSFSQTLNLGRWEGNLKIDCKETVYVVPTGSGYCPVESC
jgi:hypothetical protein